MTATDTQAKPPGTANSVFGIVGWCIVVSLSFVILLFVLCGPHFFGHSIKVGDQAESDLRALRISSVVDEKATTKAREGAALEIRPVVTRDPERVRAILNNIDARLDLIGRIQKGETVPKSTDATSADLAAASQYLAAHCPDFAQFRSEVTSTAERFVNRIDLHPYDDRNQWRLQLVEFLPDNWDEKKRSATASLLLGALGPNVSMDQTATEKALQAAVAAVKPVMRQIEVGQLIVVRGDTITRENLETLHAAGITNMRDPNLATLIAVALSAAFGLVGIFLHQYAPKLFFSPSALAMMSTVGIVVCAIAASPFGSDIPQFIPLPAATLTLSLTYGKRVTAVIVALIALFLSVSEFVTGAHLVALSLAAAVTLVMRVKRRKDLMLTGFLIGFVQMFGYLIAVACGLSKGTTINFAVDLPLEVAGGLFSSVLAIGCLPFLESIFGILTPYRIAELAEPDQPLMRQLEENAPGTYQHSLAVANLAEGGARAIGADVSLVRTGAMYHDIGKMVTPRFFIENQLGDKNPHDFIAPEESRAKVLAHVTNGLALAQKYGLPKAVQAFIPEHQGTTVMAYFYHKACLRDGSDNVRQIDYRYPGPKPQTKESAIVMLADVSEAVTHSMKDPSQEEVEEAIARVFKARWEDEQFNQSTLTIEELERVKHGFLRVWRTLHHDRLKYPSTTTGRMPIAPAPGAFQAAALPAAADGSVSAAPQAVPTTDNGAQPQSKISAAIEEASCCGGPDEDVVKADQKLDPVTTTREEVVSDK
ncbi:MAG: HDIG domain-containing protein [Candidatus Obscuribacterales bacterium]|nr:HDIG domain-containing protein [Candidatus Obscuribacterales bacterium]